MVLLPTSLSRDLFDVYADYKKSTNEVIRWLSRHSDGCEERSYLSSIRELRYFADCVIRKSISIPDELLSTFRQAIRARKRLTKFYKECTGADQGSTETHTYFNETFEGVFKDLCQFCRRVSCHCAEVDTEQSQELSNRYSALSDRTDLEDVSDRRDSGVFTASCDSTPSLVQARNIVQRCDRQGPAIADDCLEEMTQVYTCLIEIEHLVVSVNRSFYASATGFVPIAVAATTTNAVYQCAQSLDSRLQRYGISNPAKLQERYSQTTENCCTEDECPSDNRHLKASSNNQIQLLSDLNLLWEELCKFKHAIRSHGEVEYLCPCGACGKTAVKYPQDNPADFFPCASEQGEHSVNDDRNKYREALQTLFRGMFHTIQNGQHLQGHASSNLLFLKDFEVFMRDGDEVGAGCCALCVGIVLLHQSYECFCNANTNTSCKGSEVTAPAVLTTVTPRLPRLRALKLANELKAAVTTTLQSREVPCTCLQIRGASVVAQMVQCCSSLSHFVTTNRFDFFYQAPWVSGAHSVGHIAQAADAGSKAWHFSYLVGTLLHVYNALVQSKLIDPTAVPILEALCDVYEDVLFLGKRSSHNVLSCWQRWAGGKVAKATTHRNQTSLTTLASGEVVENKKWHLCAVPDSSQGGNRWSRSFDPKKISLFSLLAGGASVIDDEVLVWVYLPKEKRHRYQDKDVAKAKALFEQKNLLAYHIDRVQSLLEEEFRTTDSSPSSSSVPVARINYFAVYQACTLAMRNISDANHDEDPGYICKCPAEACMRECDAFLKRRMLGSGGKKSAKPKEMKGSDSCAEHILQVFGGRGVEEFLWKV